MISVPNMDQFHIERLEDEFGNCLGIEPVETEVKFTTAISMIHNFSKALAYAMIN